MNWDALDMSILGPALLAGLIVLSTHVPLGQKVLERGIIFIDLAVAQMAGLGVIAAHSWGTEPESLMVQVSAFGAAIVGALILYWTERYWPQVQEALIGSSFVLAATASILLLANDPQGGEHLKDLLVGQILWVDAQSLWPPVVISALVLLAWFKFRARENIAAFYGLFAVAVTASVQMVGVYLVFASLIIPALGSRHLSGYSRMIVAFAIGIFGYGGGLILSALIDAPAGPLIVWLLALAAIVSAVLRHHLLEGSLR